MHSIRGETSESDDEICTPHYPRTIRWSFVILNMLDKKHQGNRSFQIGCHDNKHQQCRWVADEKPLNCHCQAGDGVKKHGRLDVLEQQCEAISKSLVATLGEGGARLILDPLPCLPKGEVYLNQTNAGCCPVLDATMGNTVALPALPHVAWWDSGCSEMGRERPAPTAHCRVHTAYKEDKFNAPFI